MNTNICNEPLKVLNALLEALNLLLSHGLLLGKYLYCGAVGCISELYHSQEMSECDNMRHTFQSKCRIFLTCWEMIKSTPTPETAQAAQLVCSDMRYPAEMMLH